ncbi:MAG: MFS transporter [Candidatus Abyssobacteria bacterium SURF_5]|uniref:MFS transporter n=1 Tax=Abyssobacteria bacterium (strain SURF_5) TaxID=2093360 RepID=A0A3A4NP74_ABYX5|nr:MAG: MFS transporter [Candidatus Abyssubacteria bacterium SURF_5]
MTAEKRKIYYGWYIVAVCFLAMFFLSGIGYTFAVYFKVFIEEFKWSRTALSGVVSASLVVGGLAAPFWGNWTDRAGGRAVMITAAFFAGLSLLLRAGISTLWQLYVISIAGSVFFAGVSLIPLSAIISHWFQKKRGAAMGLTLIGGSTGGFLMPPLAEYLIELTGWRISYLILAVILWGGVIPVAALILRRSPSAIGLLPDGKGSESERMKPGGLEEIISQEKTVKLPAEEFTLQQAMRTVTFWMIAAAFFFPMMSGVGLITHLVVVLTDAGIDTRLASVCLGLVAILGIAGRVTFGFAADRFPVRKVFTACYILETISVCMLLALPLIGTKAFFAYVLVYGLTGGGGLVLAPLIIGECFGLKSLGAIFGVLAISGVAGGAIGPLLAGFIFDTTGGYYLAFVIFATGEAIAAFAISRAKIMRSPSIETAIVAGVLD